MTNFQDMLSKAKEMQNKMKENFVNYGAKDDRTELFWYSRVIMINKFMKDYQLE